MEKGACTTTTMNLSTLYDSPEDFSTNAHEMLSACNRELLDEKFQDRMKAAKCYMERAKFYLQMRFFNHCLNSLDQAESIYFSMNGAVDKLRIKCKAEMKKFKDMSTNPYANKFKLSYSANPKLPFFIDALDVSQDFIFGKVLTTKENLKAGDVIAEINDPINKVSQMRSSLCAYCMQNNNFDLQTHEKFIGVMFCSNRCKNDYSKFYDIHHGCLVQLDRVLGRDAVIVDKETKLLVLRVLATSKIFDAAKKHFEDPTVMRKFIDGLMFDRFTVFDYTWTSMSKFVSFEQTFACIMCTKVDPAMRYRATLDLARFGIDAEIIAKKSTYWFNEDFAKNVEEAFIQIYCVLEECAKYVETEVDGKNKVIGICFHPSMLLLNHSCDPNVIVHMMNNGKVVWVVCRPIAAGERIFINYTPEYYSRDPSVSKTKVLCKYPDTCEPCIRRWRENLDYEEIEKSKSEKIEMVMESLAAAPDSFRTECDIINACYKNLNGKKMKPKARNEIVKHLMKLQDALSVMENPFINVERVKTEMAEKTHSESSDEDLKCS